jgi:drug/metabolite transporter (DMT)-like permease
VQEFSSENWRSTENLSFAFLRAAAIPQSTSPAFPMEKRRIACSSVGKCSRFPATTSFESRASVSAKARLSVRPETRNRLRGSSPNALVARIRSPLMLSQNRFAILLAFAALYIIWGSTYLGIALAIESIPPFLMAGTRFFFAGVIMYAVARISGAPRPRKSTWQSAVIIGGCLLLCGNGGVTISEKWVPTGLASVIVATVPIDIVLLSWVTGLTRRPNPLIWVGLAGGFLGVGLLIGPALTAPSSSNHFALGIFILLMASLIWSAGSLYSLKAKSSPSLFLAAGQQMICGGALLFFLGVSLGEKFNFQKISPTSSYAFIYLVLVGALIGYTAYFWLLRHCEPAKVATYAYVNPVVAVILGVFFHDERLTARAIVAASLIVGSVAMVITAQQFKAKAVVGADAESLFCGNDETRMTRNRQSKCEIRES